MDYIKEAFKKVKKDIEDLQKEKIFFELNLAELKDELKEIKGILEELRKNSLFSKKTDSAEELNKPTYTIYNPAHNLGFQPLKSQNLGISIGNQGVPADRQTDRQTDRHTQKDSIDSAVEILNSLDNIKREIRLKFKKLTEKEWLVFSTIYQLDEEQGFADHKILSERLNLTESSIRDYIGRLIKKEIPLEKIKINNKSIRISVSENLKKIVSLPTILQLREL